MALQKSGTKFRRSATLMHKIRFPGVGLLTASILLSVITPVAAIEQENDVKTSPKNIAAADPFLWLEEVQGEKALGWARSQNERTLKELKADSRFEGFEQSALAILNSTDRIAAPALVGNMVRNFWQDETHVRGIWRQATLASYLNGEPEWDVILDVDALAKSEEENWVWEGANCLSPDEDRCIIQLSRGGSDAAVQREFIISEKTFVKDGFYLPEMKGGIAWIDQDTVLVGGDIDEDGLTDSGYPLVTRLWKRGQAASDAKIIFRGDKTDVGIWPGSIAHKAGNFVYITQSRTFYEREYFKVAKDGSVEQLALPRKSSINGFLNGSIIISLQEDWITNGSKATAFKSGDLISTSIVKGHAKSDATHAELFSELVFSPTPRQSVQGVRVSKSAIYVQLLDNIVGSVKKFDRVKDGTVWSATNIELPGDGDVSLGSINDQGSDFFLYFDSPTEPATLYYLDAEGKRAKVKQSPTFFDADGVVMRQFEATSKDGTKVPYFVIGREAVMDAGNAPTIQYGYGGFEIPITPGYAALTGKLWYENDGLYVIANIRGGGEFGPRWHQAALKQNRQRAFDDFFAVSEDLIEKGLTSSAKLGALGGSNGGLLMGVAMTQRPDLYNALGIGVPLLDMLRYHKLLAGASWMGEYGDPDIPEERAFIEKYSPYQNLVEDGDYPRVYFFTSTKDDRVHPGHARKMAAKMESHGQPFLYYENIEGGHGAAANLKQLAFRQALQYVYFLRQLSDDQE